MKVYSQPLKCPEIWSWALKKHLKLIGTLGKVEALCSTCTCVIIVNISGRVLNTSGAMHWELSPHLRSILHLRSVIRFSQLYSYFSEAWCCLDSWPLTFFLSEGPTKKKISKPVTCEVRFFFCTTSDISDHIQNFKCLMCRSAQLESQLYSIKWCQSEEKSVLCLRCVSYLRNTNTRVFNNISAIKSGFSSRNVKIKLYISYVLVTF